MIRLPICVTTALIALALLVLPIGLTGDAQAGARMSGSKMGGAAKRMRTMRPRSMRSHRMRRRMGRTGRMNRIRGMRVRGARNGRFQNRRIRNRGMRRRARRGMRTRAGRGFTRFRNRGAVMFARKRGRIGRGAIPLAGGGLGDGVPVFQNGAVVGRFGGGTGAPVNVRRSFGGRRSIIPAQRTERRRVIRAARIVESLHEPQQTRSTTYIRRRGDGRMSRHIRRGR